MLLRRRLAVLVATASIAVMMLLVIAPVALALDVPYIGRSPFAPAPEVAPGAIFRSNAGQLHDQRIHETGPNK